MKIAIIGAAGLRTPLLLHGLVRSDLPISGIDLYDPDSARLSLLMPLLSTVAGGVPLRVASESRSAISGSRFVLTSIRVGGMRQRARDEAACLRHGVLGQETVGPAGFAMAMRTIRPMLQYAREVEEAAPDAFMISFSNPVGIVTQAVTSQTKARIIGICDTPTELFEEAAASLGVPSSQCRYDFVGLNHLGWLREVYLEGRPTLHRLLPASAGLYRAGFFEPEEITRLGLLPTEYVYFYYHPERALAAIQSAGRSRGEQLEELNARFWERLPDAADPVGVYYEYLQTRDASYMQTETATTPRRPVLGELTGYDRIALAVMRAIHFHQGAVLPLNVANRGNLPELNDEDVVEVPCRVDGNGAAPLHVGRLPVAVRDLVERVKSYERLTVEATLAGGETRAVRALQANPLVPAGVASALLPELGVVL